MVTRHQDVRSGDVNHKGLGFGTTCLTCGVPDIFLYRLSPVRFKMPTEDTARVDELVATMSARLRPLCADWPERVFHEMVTRLARITIRYEGSVTTGVYDRRRTERLVEEMRAMIEKSEAERQRDAADPDANR
jgi:hypothetical protein